VLSLNLPPLSCKRVDTSVSLFFPSKLVPAFPVPFSPSFTFVDFEVSSARPFDPTTRALPGHRLLWFSVFHGFKSSLYSRRDACTTSAGAEERSLHPLILLLYAPEALLRFGEPLLLPLFCSFPGFLKVPSFVGPPCGCAAIFLARSSLFSSKLPAHSLFFYGPILRLLLASFLWAYVLEPPLPRHLSFLL